MFSRGWMMNQLGKDDWAMFAAWVLTVAYLGIIGLSTRYGQGLPGAEQKPEWLEPALKCVLAIELVYYLTVYLIKCSILFFYLRLGRNAVHWFHKMAKNTIYLLSIFLVVCLIVVFLQCIPLARNWNIFEKGSCINTTAFFYSTSVFNIITDVWILALPVKLLWHVQRPNLEKVILLAVFTMGVFACVASCIRLYTVKLFTQSLDPLYDAVPINIWSMIEINVAIICASVPALKAVFGMRSNSRSSTGNSGGNQSSGHSNPVRPGRLANRRPSNRAGGAIPLKGIKRSQTSTTLSTSFFAGESEEKMTGINTAESTPMSGAGGDDSFHSYGYDVGVSAAKEVGHHQVPNSGEALQSYSYPSHGIGYQRDVVVRVEKWGNDVERARDVGAEDGRRYGGRPGKRGGPTYGTAEEI